MQPDRLGSTQIYVTLVVKWQENAKMEQSSSGLNENGTELLYLCPRQI
jgi:hypothetical protein